MVKALMLMPKSTNQQHLLPHPLMPSGDTFGTSALMIKLKRDILIKPLMISHNSEKSWILGVGI
jgi:hypothetical protein